MSTQFLAQCHECLQDSVHGHEKQKCIGMQHIKLSHCMQAPRQGECEVSADQLAKWQDRLVANLVTDGAKAEEAFKFVSTLDYTASKRRADKSVQWVMHDHVSAKRFKSSTEVREHFKQAEVREQFKSAAPQTVGLY